MSIYDTLNEQQKKRCFHNRGAGASAGGSRFRQDQGSDSQNCYLIDELGVNPWNIMAITFTNKAAGEMKERVEKLVEFGGSIWVTTFHSTCVRILRRYIDRLGYDNSFTIYDTDDSRRVVKDILKELNLDDKAFPPKNDYR